MNKFVWFWLGVVTSALMVIVIIHNRPASKGSQVESQGVSGPSSNAIGVYPGVVITNPTAAQVSGQKVTDGNYKIDYNGHTILVAISNYHVIDGHQQWTVTFSDEQGHLQTFTRQYTDPQDRNHLLGPADEMYLDDRTYSYATPETDGGANDPLRHLMEFSGPGLYVWIYEGLYYYDPATGKFGLDLPSIP